MSPRFPRSYRKQPSKQKEDFRIFGKTEKEWVEQNVKIHKDLPLVLIQREL